MRDKEEWEAEKLRMQIEWRKLMRQVSSLSKKQSIARDRLLIADARAHDLKLRAKSAEKSLSVLEPDAHRYRYLKKIGSEKALAILESYLPDIWDEIIDRILCK